MRTRDGDCVISRPASANLLMPPPRIVLPPPLAGPRTPALSCRLVFDPSTIPQLFRRGLLRTSARTNALRDCWPATACRSWTW